MAWPKGITRAKLNEMKEAGTAEAWMSEHAKQSEAGTLDAWLATQDLKPSGAPVGTSSTVKAAPKLRRAPALERLLDASKAFHGTVSNGLENQEVSHEDIASLCDLEDSLGAIRKAAGELMATIRPVVDRLQREADLQARNDELEASNAALEARVAEMEAALKANGHSDKVTDNRPRDYKGRLLKGAMAE